MMILDLKIGGFRPLMKCSLINLYKKLKANYRNKFDQFDIKEKFNYVIFFNTWCIIINLISKRNQHADHYPSISDCTYIWSSLSPLQKPRPHHQ